MGARTHTRLNAIGQACVLAVLVACCLLGVGPGPAIGAGAPVTVSATVPSMVTLDTSGCNSGSQYTTEVLADNPVAYWRLGEAVGPTAADISGNANNGTYAAGVAPGAPGAITADANTAPTFTAAGKVTATVPPITNGAGTFTSVEMWVYWTGTTNQIVFGFSSYDLYFHGGGFGFNTSAGDVWGVPSAGMANRWMHVVAMFHNGDARQGRIFIDGAEQTLSQQLAVTGAGSSVVDNVAIGGWVNDESFRFAGKVDEVSIYNGALPRSRVVSHYEAGRASGRPTSFGATLFPGNSYTTADCTVTFGSSNDSSMLRMYQRDGGGVAMTGGPSHGLVGWWPLNGNMNDASLLGNPMTVGSGAPDAVAGKLEYGQALSFNGTTDGMSIAQRAAYEVDTYTVDMWFKTPALGPDGNNMLVHRGTSMFNRSFGMWFTGGNLVAGFYPTSGDTQAVTAGAGYVDNQWHHVAMVVDGEAVPKRLTLYVDGVSRATTTYTGSVTHLPAPIEMGWWNGSNRFAGQLDELRVQNVARPMADIRAYYLGAVKDYQAGVDDWLTPSRGFFGACLRAVSGVGVSGTWAPNATCPKTDIGHWKPIAIDSSGATAKVVQSTTAGTLNATAQIVFGYRTLDNQPNGSYTAPVVFEAIAPNVP